MRTILYYKTGCPYAAEVMEFLKENEIPYEARDITATPYYKEEVIDKTGQSKSPTLDIDGILLPDAGVEDVAAFFEKVSR